MAPRDRRRREWLQATAAAAAIGFARPGKAEPARRLKAGFLGGAHSHGPEKWKCLARSSDYELVGIAEDDPKVRAQFESLGAKALSQEALLEQCDVAIVESDVASHARLALAAVEANKHVHLEKAPASTFADFARVVDAAKQRRRLIQVGYMWRYHPGFARIFEAVAKGWLGDVYLVRGVINNQLPAARRPGLAQFAGGLMFELGSHLIDATVRLLGSPTSVSASLRSDGRPKDALRDNCLAVLQFESAQAVIYSAALQPGSGRHRTFEVLGTKGTATLRPIEPPRLELDLASAAGPYRAGVNIVPMPTYERYIGDFAAFARAIHGQEPLSVDLETDLLVHRAVLQASRML
jgi:predicted dehydrogenase